MGSFLDSSCDGAQPAYQIAVGAAQPFHAFVTDLATAGATFDISGTAPATYLATRSQATWRWRPLAASFAAAAVVNAATFTAGIAPGGIMAIFGAGLSGLRRFHRRRYRWRARRRPAGLAVPDQCRGSGGHGPRHAQPARAIGFRDGGAVGGGCRRRARHFPDRQPAGGRRDQPGQQPELPSNPLPRGQQLVIYCTGLGATMAQGQLSVAASPVTVLLNGQPLTPAFAGMTPGVPGLYQVNVAIPRQLPPAWRCPLP